MDRFVERYEERDRLSFLRKGRGLWKDRTDLPDLSELRKEWDRVDGPELSPF